MFRIRESTAQIKALPLGLLQFHGLLFLWCRADNKDCLPSSDEWLARILSGPAGRQRDLLQLSAAWHLRGRRLLHGNPVALPVLGKSRFFRAELEVGLSHLQVHEQSRSKA